MTFKGSKQKLKDIAREVNVRYVLEGSVRKAGNKLRITSQLIDASTDVHLWAEKYNGTLDDVFDIQEKVSRSIAEALKIKLKTEEANTLANRPIVNAQVYEYLLRAKNDIYSFTKQGLDSGIKILQTGLDIFGENELVYAALGDAYYLYFDFGFETDKAILNKVEEYSTKTLALNHNSGYAYKLLALLERGNGSLKKACQYIKKAYDSEPNDSGIQLYAAGFLSSYADKRFFAIPVFDNLLRIDPLSPMNYLFYGVNMFVIGDYEKAIELVNKSFELSPDYIMSKFWLANIFAANHQKDKALKTIDEALAMKAVGQPFNELLLFFKHILLGEKEKAFKVLSQETQTYTWNDPDFSYFMAGYYALLDEKEISYKWVEHALDRDFINYTYWSKFPFLDNLRQDGRFKELLDRIKIEWENFNV
jgi:non-specific serine/threonine protein kinase